MSALDKIFVALDQMNEEQVLALLEKGKGRLKKVKIGLELYYRFGPELLRKVKDKYGVDIFLDLKIHDIPTTSTKALASLKNVPFDYLTTHLVGGPEMLKAQVEEAMSWAKPPTLLGVTYLTSLDASHFSALYGSWDQYDAYFSKLLEWAHESSMGGLILSALDLGKAKEKLTELKSPLLKVCPGIRMKDSSGKTKLHDQKRSLSPEEAFDHGADLLVIGRSITQSANLEHTLDELEHMR